MNRLRTVLIPVLGVLALASTACSDGGNADTSTETSGNAGDGDGDPTTTGDGDGDPATTTGDGDGDDTTTTTGDGDGDDTTTGDGDGDPGCFPGELGCECNEGLCLGNLECVDGVCTDDCIPGELGCACNGGLCLGDLECVDNLCSEPGGDGDGDNDFCPAPNEEWCDGMCVDVVENNDHCGGCGVECTVKQGGVGECVDSDCTPTWSDCIPEDEGLGMNCDEICALTGQTCVEMGCGIGNWTVTYASVPSSCNSGGGEPAIAPCDFELFNWPLGNVGCCCMQ